MDLFLNNERTRNASGGSAFLIGVSGDLQMLTTFLALFVG